METREFISKSPSQTQKFAENFARNLKAGDILAIYGPLGAGKTTFIQGLAKGLGFNGRVFSPTFIFVRPYKLANSKQKVASSQKKSKARTLYHIDLYRIEKPIDAKTIGIDEFLKEKEGICAIEWPERIKGLLPEKTTKITIETLGSNERKVKVT